MKQRWLSLAFVSAAFLLLTLPRPSSADPVPEYAMKATFLYNFAKFTEWPALPRKSFNLCILGHNPFGTFLDNIEGQLVHDLPLTVVRLSLADNLKNCQILFFDASESVNAKRILDQLGDAPVLTITDAEGLVQNGMMIGMITANNRIVFEVNFAAVRHVRLNISSKLMRLAQKVY
jgi:hypothetical protein